MKVFQFLKTEKRGYIFIQKGENYGTSKIKSKNDVTDKLRGKAGEEILKKEMKSLVVYIKTYHERSKISIQINRSRYFYT